MNVSKLSKHKIDEMIASKNKNDKRKEKKREEKRKKQVYQEIDK